MPSGGLTASTILHKKYPSNLPYLSVCTHYIAKFTPCQLLFTNFSRFFLPSMHSQKVRIPLFFFIQHRQLHAACHSKPRPQLRALVLAVCVQEFQMHPPNFRSPPRAHHVSSLQKYSLSSPASYSPKVKLKEARCRMSAPVAFPSSACLSMSR